MSIRRCRPFPAVRAFAGGLSLLEWGAVGGNFNEKGACGNVLKMGRICSHGLERAGELRSFEDWEALFCAGGFFQRGTEYSGP